MGQDGVANDGTRGSVHGLQFGGHRCQHLLAVAGALAVGGVHHRVAQALERLLRQRATQQVDGGEVERDDRVMGLAHALAYLLGDRAFVGLLAAFHCGLAQANRLRGRTQPRFGQLACHGLEAPCVVAQGLVQLLLLRAAQIQAGHDQAQVQDGGAIGLGHAAPPLDGPVDAKRLHARGPVGAEAVGPRADQRGIQCLHAVQDGGVAALEALHRLQIVQPTVAVTTLKRIGDHADAIAESRGIVGHDLLPLLQIGIVCLVDACPRVGVALQTRLRQRARGHGLWVAVEAMGSLGTGDDQCARQRKQRGQAMSQEPWRAGHGAHSAGNLVDRLQSPLECAETPVKRFVA